MNKSENKAGTAKDKAKDTPKNSASKGTTSKQGSKTTDSKGKEGNKAKK